MSLGGYYAPRDRLREAHQDHTASGPFEWKEIWAALPVRAKTACAAIARPAGALKHAATPADEDAAPNRL